MPFSGQGAGQGAGQTDDRPARLVAAARDLANETGNSAFTVAQVAARAGLSLKSFYRCFRSKDELLIALLEDDSRLGASIIGERVRGADDPLRTYVEELFALAALPGAAGYAAILVREHRRLTERQPEAVQRALEPLTSLLADLLDSADPKRDAETMFGVLLSGIHEFIVGRADPRELAAYLYRFCTHGVHAR